MLQQEDLNLMRKKGITREMLELQLSNFRQGFPFIRLLRPAIQGDGIIVIKDEKKTKLVQFYEEQANALRVIKFVPASGAASRMFKSLFEFRESITDHQKVPESYSADTGVNSARYFFQHIRQFAFYEELKASMEAEGLNIDRLLDANDFAPVLDHLLGPAGLNYSSLPKALLAFHSYNDGPRTAMEEHLVEAGEYAKDGNNVSSIHFTLSPEHIEKFEARVSSVQHKYETRFKTHFKITHSIQKTSTDTIAVDADNNPFRNSNGSLLFRPAGHGALLSNLNELNADIIFIKNIDNIVPDRLKPETIRYKKLIGGYLLSVRQMIFNFLENADSGNLKEEEIREMASFTLAKKLIPLPHGFENLSADSCCKILARELNRPIRVCGMVKNAGEPGGGPFWVTDSGGNASLQIVESSQVNMNDAGQRTIFNSSTHFNPVDLVCCTIDYKGNPFKLQEFVDDSTGFISLKSSGGQVVKAQELPGLWNGSMAGWITLFVEVPLTTFNPVKTINDLLRNEHQ